MSEREGDTNTLGVMVFDELHNLLERLEKLARDTGGNNAEKIVSVYCSINSKWEPEVCEWAHIGDYGLKRVGKMERLDYEPTWSGHPDWVENVNPWQIESFYKPPINNRPAAADQSTAER